VTADVRPLPTAGDPDRAGEEPPLVTPAVTPAVLLGGDEGGWGLLAVPVLICLALTIFMLMS
jgi:hypothetical protein